MFLVINICACSNPLHDLSICITTGRSAAQKPAVSSVRRPLETIFDLIVFPGGKRAGPSVNAELEVIRMHHRAPAPVLRLRKRESGVIKPGLVVVIETAI